VFLFKKNKKVTKNKPPSPSPPFFLVFRHQGTKTQKIENLQLKIANWNWWLPEYLLIFSFLTCF